MSNIELKGTKLFEVPYFIKHLDEDKTKSILIIGECKGGIEGVSESILEAGYNNVTTTDILPTEPESWLRQNTDWKHIQCDFIEFDETEKYDTIVSISVFEHFGFWFAGDRMFEGEFAEDVVRWNHDIVGMKKAASLLRDENSKLIITVPAGPYMNYDDNGYPFLRYYDWNRREVIKRELGKLGFKITNEQLFYTKDYTSFDEVGLEIMHPKYVVYHNAFSPNVGWCFTIQKAVI